MSNIWFISDLHYGHENMAKKRGFSCSEDQDEFMIEQINSTVKKRDTLWILGDVTMEKPYYEFLDQLRGIKKVCLGNHDKLSHVPELLGYVNHVFGIHKYKKHWLSHCPIHPSELRGLPNIHGHVHENTVSTGDESDKLYVNVSCEVLNFKPISLVEIDEILRERKVWK